MSKITIFVVILIVIVVLFLYFTMKRKIAENKEKSKEKQKIFEALLTPFMGRNLFFNFDEDILYDENLSPIDFGDKKIRLRFSLHKDSIYPKRFPVIITSIEDYIYSDSCDYTANLQIRDIPYEFEIVYCGDCDAIAKSPKLGDIYLPKKEYRQYEVGKKISIITEAKKWDNTNIYLVNPKIVA